MRYLIGLLVVVFAVSEAFDWGFLRTQITYYPVFCKDQEQTGPCQTGWQRGVPTTYTVYADDQTVVSQPRGNPPTKLSRCAVVDRKNWKCYFTSTGGWMIGFTDGKYWSGAEIAEGSGILAPGATQTEYVQDVSKLRWLLTESVKTP